MAHRTWKEAYKQSIGLKEAKYTNIHNKIKNIKNLSRKQADMIADIDPAVLAKVLQNLYPMFKAQRLVSSVEEDIKESVTDFILDEGMVDIEKARKLPDNIQKQILDLKKEYDRTWDGVFVPMGKEGSSQRKEYKRRGKLFKAASKKYKDFLKKHKVANFK